VLVDWKLTRNRANEGIELTYHSKDCGDVTVEPEPRILVANLLEQLQKLINKTFNC